MHLLDLLSKQRDNIYLLDTAERTTSELSKQVHIYENNLKKVHKELMTQVFRDIQKLKRT